MSSDVFVRIAFSRSSKAFLDALSELLQAVSMADRALLEDRIALAHSAVELALLDPDAVGFELDT